MHDEWGDLKARRTPSLPNLVRPAVFRSDMELYHADTCQPLADAASRGEVELVALGRGSYPGGRLPTHDLKEVCLTGYWNATKDQTWGLDWHRNEGIELAFVEAGCIPFQIGDHYVDLEAGHLTITRPWQHHRVGNPMVPASRYHWLIIDVGIRRPNEDWHWPKWILYPKDRLDRLTTILRQNEQASWRASREVSDCFRRLGKLARGGSSPENITRIKIVINELIIDLAEFLTECEPKLDESLSSKARAVRLFFDELPERLDEPWTLGSMAEACGIGRSTFSALCKELTNATPIDHLTQCRLLAACERIKKEPNALITDVAFDCGFQSSQYFSTVFRAKFKKSPREWRESLP